MNANIKVVERKCLNDIINWLSHEQFSGQCANELYEQGYNLHKDNDCQRLYLDMLWLNLQAVQGRHIETEDYDDFNFERSSKPSFNQALKSIHYWLCQCMYEPTASSRLFRTFSRLIRQIPEWKKAVYSKPYSLPKSQVELLSES